MKYFLSILLLFIFQNVGAADLVQVSGRVDYTCPVTSTELETYFEMARIKALQQIDDPSKYIQVSDWKKASMICHPNWPEHYVIVGASFVLSSQYNEPWFVETEGNMSSDDYDDENSHSDDESFEIAKSEAIRLAEKLCPSGHIIDSTILEQKKEPVEGYPEVFDYTVKVKSECQK